MRKMQINRIYDVRTVQGKFQCAVFLLGGHYEGFSTELSVFGTQFQQTERILPFKLNKARMIPLTNLVSVLCRKKKP